MAPVQAGCEVLQSTDGLYQSRCCKWGDLCTIAGGLWTETIYLCTEHQAMYAARGFTVTRLTPLEAQSVNSQSGS